MRYITIKDQTISITRPHKRQYWTANYIIPIDGILEYLFFNITSKQGMYFDETNEGIIIILIGKQYIMSLLWLTKLLNTYLGVDYIHISRFANFRLKFWFILWGRNNFKKIIVKSVYFFFKLKSSTRTMWCVVYAKPTSFI